MERADTLYVETRSEWRAWLRKHHLDASGVWLNFYKKASGKDSVPYDDAVEEALCFGWIDGVFHSVDDTRYVRWFSPRRSNAKWSALNLERVRKMITQKKMTAAGLAKLGPGVLESNPAPRPKELPVPDFFAAALAEHHQALENFNRLGASYRRNYIGWISSAKREETQQRRIAEAIGLLERNEKLGMK